MVLRLSMTKRLACVALVAVTATGLGLGSARAAGQMQIVGSSTLYPFAAYVAEELGVTTKFATPVVESTGSGGGLRLFCAGTGPRTPDIANASRRMKVSEFEQCQVNGVKNITEVVIGYDGIVFAQNGNNPQWDLSREQLTLALAAEVPRDGQLVVNPYTNWQQIDPDFPDREILVYGPPTSSGTRDAFEELVMAYGSEHIDGYDGVYTTIRRDGVYVPGGENDNLLVQRLTQNPSAFALFGYSYLEENQGLIQAARVDGVEPRRELISSGQYPVARSLFFYTKNSHLDQDSGMATYVDLFLSDRMSSDKGFLTTLGLIPLAQDERETIRSRWEARQALTRADLENSQ